MRRKINLILEYIGVNHFNRDKMKMLFVHIMVGGLFLLSACRQRELNACDGGGVELPACDFVLGREDLKALTKLSNEIGIVVQYTRFSGQDSRVRIKLKGTDTNLDPCNLPEDVAVNSEIRFCATWYELKNYDHLNLDYFPIEFSKFEILNTP